MIVFVITSECPDQFYDDEFDGHVFSTKEKAQQYVDTARGAYSKSICEVEVDKLY